ncbi:hypothetical protein BT69DRAFT_1334398 [Atractiella rhizophila]|nr:hypothetical protein BT69DRAFT_1334398 [Atractiella rhizophila]
MDGDIDLPFPTEIMIQIFEYMLSTTSPYGQLLPSSDLCSFARVNKRWNSIVQPLLAKYAVLLFNLDPGDDGVRREEMFDLGRRLMRDGWKVSSGTKGESGEDDGLKIAVLRDSPVAQHLTSKYWKCFFDFFHAGFLLFFSSRITYLHLEVYDPDLPLTFNFPSLRTLTVEGLVSHRGIIGTLHEVFPHFADFSSLQVLDIRNIDFFNWHSNLPPPTFVLRSLSISYKSISPPEGRTPTPKILGFFQYMASAFENRLERLRVRTAAPERATVDLFDSFDLISCNHIVFFSYVIEYCHLNLPVFPPLPKLKHLEFGSARYGIQDLPLLSTFPSLNQSRNLKSLKLTEVAIVFPPPESDFHFDAADWKFQLEKLDWTHPRDKFTPSDVFLSLQILHPDPCSPSIRAFRLSYLSFGDPTHNNLFLSPSTPPLPPRIQARRPSTSSKTTRSKTIQTRYPPPPLNFHSHVRTARPHPVP